MNQSSSPVRVAVIGCGFWGLEHIESYLDLDGVEISVCDLDPQRRMVAAERAGTDRAYADYRELLERERPNLVSVCTMPKTHLEVTLAALEVGSNVLCEKPMADSLANAQAMVDAAEHSEGFLSIGYEMRYTPRARYIKEFIDAGGLGRAVYARCWQFAEFPWIYKPELESVRASVVASRRGGGTVSAGGIHAIDLALWMGGFGAPKSVTAIGAQMFPRKRGASAPVAEIAEIYDVDDLATAFIRFDDDSWMVHESAHGGIDRLDPENTRDTVGFGFVLVGEKATITFAPFQILSNDEEGRVVDVTPKDPFDWGFRIGLRHEIADVVDAVRTGRAPIVTAREALQAELIKQHIYTSMDQRREITV